MHLKMVRILHFGGTQVIANCRELVPFFVFSQNIELVLGFYMLSIFVCIVRNFSLKRESLMGK
jgi:cytochrome b subunit of formate dehydrogenase